MEERTEAMIPEFMLCSGEPDHSPPVVTGVRVAEIAGREHSGIPMHSNEQRMTTGQLRALLDAAQRSPSPLSFLDAVVLTFSTAGRDHDATTTAWIGCLYAEGEIELLMRLRAAWRRGENASPGEVAQSAARRHRASGDALARRTARQE